MTRRLGRALLPALLPALLLAGRPAPAAPPVGDEETVPGLEEAIRLFDLADTARVTAAFRDEALARVLDELGDVAGIPIGADWDGLASLDVGPREGVTLRLEGRPLSTVLTALTLQLGDEYGRPYFEAAGGRIVLTTESAASGLRWTAAYDVRDLIADGDTTALLAADRRAGADSGEVSEPEPEPEPKPKPKPGPGPSTAGERLMKLLADHVDPEAWDIYGGVIGTISERRGLILVSAPASLHRRFRATLADLRRASITSVFVEAALVDLPRETYERFLRRHGPTTAAMARAVRGAGETQWRGTALVLLEETAAIRTEDEGGSVTVEIAPRFDRPRGLLAMDVRAATIAGPDRRTVETTVNVPLRGGAAILEMAARDARPTVRLAVIEPRRE